MRMTSAINNSEAGVETVLTVNAVRDLIDVDTFNGDSADAEY